MERAPVQISKATDIAKDIMNMRKPNDSDNPEDISEQQLKKAEQLEASLERHALWTASIVLSVQSCDYFGNERPYNCEPVTEPVFCGINMYEDECPMLFQSFEGQEAVKQREAFRELAKHPFFKNDQGSFAGIEKLFEALELNGKPEDWTLACICRSYYLHNG